MKTNAQKTAYVANDSFSKNSFVLAFLLFITITLYLAFGYTNLPPVVPFFYSVIRSERQLAQKEFLVVLPTLMFIFNLSHLILARFIFNLDKIFTRILATSSLLIALLFSIATVHIITIVL